MYRRKDIRYSIARCRKEGEHPPENMEIFTWVMEQKPEKLDIADFPDKWDIMLSKDTILFVEPERDISFIQQTCAEAKVLTKHNIGFDELSDRQKNIITIVETSMLDGKMTWENYSDGWRVTLDVSNNQMGTQLLGGSPGQKAVTSEMIEQSGRAVDPTKLSEESKLRITEKEAGITHNKTINLTGENQWEKMTQEEMNALKNVQKKGSKD